MEMNNKEVNEKLENMVEKEEEDDIDEMMKELEKEVLPRPEKIAVHAEVMDVESENGKLVMKEKEKMDIES